MVFVRVREEDRLDPVGVLPQVREVGQHEIDTGHVGVGEHDPAVDEQDPLVDLDAAAVAPDLAQPAQEDDTDRVTHCAGRYHRPRRRGHMRGRESAAREGGRSCACGGTVLI